MKKHIAGLEMENEILKNLLQYSQEIKRSRYFYQNTNQNIL